MVPRPLLSELPDELQRCILEHVPLHDVLYASQCCKAFASLCAPRLDSANCLTGCPFEMTSAEIVEATSVSFSHRGLVATHAIFLAAAVIAGAFTAVNELHLGNNRLGDVGLIELSAALSKGALPACRRLSLYANEIGDEGTIALARALDAGALQNMSALLLNSNRVGDSGIVALAVAMRRGALPHLERLCLSSNAIGDHGVAELADSAACDALRTLEYLVLERNRIGHTGSVTHAISFEGNVDS